MAKPRRKLAAILSADVVDFSRLMESDDAETVRALKAVQALFGAEVGRSGGRIVNMPGDALLAEFGSAVDAVDCAARVQVELARRNQERAEDRRMRCRIGVNIGDVLADGRTLFGDGVNIAARLEALADPGGICVSGKVFDEVERKVALTFEFLGERRVKNISAPLRVYRWVPAAPLRVRVLGEIELWRGAARLDLPQSKKTRALLAYLVLSQRAVRRERLCSMFWDVADDPRAALRWSLSKLRALVDEPGAPRIVTSGATVSFALAGADVDLFSVREQARDGGAALAADELVRLAGEFRGEVLEGLELPDFHEFQVWCAAVREEARALHTRILATLVERLAGRPEAALPYARSRVQVDPLDEDARADLIRLLAACGHLHEAQRQFESAAQMLRELGAEPGDALRRAWNDAHQRRPAESTRAAAPAAAPEPAPVATVSPAAPLVGRHAEWERLVAALDATARERRLHAVLLTGEPGIGKTRLLAELSGEVGRRGGTVLEGAAYEAETRRPYGPWIDALRRVRAIDIGDTLGAELAPLLPELGAGADGQRSRERLFGAVVELIAARAHSAAPVALVLDDAQWCDDASAELLHYVGRMNRHRPVLLALAARDGELPDNEPIVKVVRSLRRDPGLDEIRVAPLTAPETAELVGGIAPEADAERVFAESAGNPLFALEVARALPHRPDGLPSTLRQLVRDRIDRLPPDAGDVLRWAAVVGPTFAVRRLAEVVPIDGERLVAALEILERHGLLRAAAAVRHAGGGYAFAHDVVRHAIYAELSDPRRRLMHLRVVRALQALGAGDGASADPRDETLVEELAHHAGLAGEAETAARACLNAGRRCLRLFAGTEADAMARRGLYHAAQLPEPDRVTLMIELAEVRYAARRPQEPAQAAAELEALAERALELGCMAHARLGFHLASYLRWEGGDWSDAQRHMLHAEQVSRGGDERDHVVALAEAARCLTLLERDLGQAEAMALEAAALGARLAMEPAAIADAVGMLRLHQGRLDEAAERFARARDLCRIQQDRLGEFRALEHLVMLELEREAFDRADTLSAELVAIAERLREGSEAPFARALAALCRRARGAEVARDDVDAACEALRVADAKQRLAYVLTHAAALDLRAGDAAAGRRHAEEALHLARLLERPSDVALARVALARAAQHQGDEATVRAQLAALNDGALQGTSARAQRVVERLRAASRAPRAPTRPAADRGNARRL